MEKVRLGDVCKKATSNIAQKDLEGHHGKFPVFGASGHIADVEFYQQDKPYIAVVKDGAGVGRVMKLPAKSSIIGTLQYILPNDMIDSDYLMFAMENMNLAKYYSGATIPHIYFKDYQNEKIYLPEMDKQREIARVINRVNCLIELRKQQLEKLDLLVKARFVEMFGTYPANEYKWETRTIRDIVTDVRYGSSRKASDSGNGKYQYLRMNNITYSGELDLSEIKTIDIPDKELPKCTVKKGDILFNRTNSKELVGKTCVYNRDEIMVLAGFIIRVRVNDKVLPEFVSTFLNTDFSKCMLYNMCKAAIGQANINAQEMQSIGIFLPPIELQEKFVHFKTQVVRSKSEIQKGLEKTEWLKSALMQKYFE